MDAPSLENVTHIIQMALTPAFLLSGIAALLNVFSARLGRVSDRVDDLADRLRRAAPAEAAGLAHHLAFQRRRSRILDIAVVLGAIGGAASCAAMLALFVGALREATIAVVLFTFFGSAVLSTLGALLAFVTEMLMASRGVREVAEEREAAAQSTVASATASADVSG